jgi:hypothetical protein
MAGFGGFCARQAGGRCHGLVFPENGHVSPQEEWAARYCDYIQYLVRIFYRRECGEGEVLW